MTFQPWKRDWLLESTIFPFLVWVQGGSSARPRDGRVRGRQAFNTKKFRQQCKFFTSSICSAAAKRSFFLPARFLLRLFLLFSLLGWKSERVESLLLLLPLVRFALAFSQASSSSFPEIREARQRAKKNRGSRNLWKSFPPMPNVSPVLSLMLRLHVVLTSVDFCLQ